MRKVIHLCCSACHRNASGEFMTTFLKHFILKACPMAWFICRGIGFFRLSRIISELKRRYFPIHPCYNLLWIQGFLNSGLRQVKPAQPANSSRKGTVTINITVITQYVVCLRTYYKHLHINYCKCITCSADRNLNMTTFIILCKVLLLIGDVLFVKALAVGSWFRLCGCFGALDEQREGKAPGQ